VRASADEGYTPQILAALLPSDRPLTMVTASLATAAAVAALSRSGRTADALAQYQGLRKRLAEDLGIDPSAELQDLNSSILADNARTRTAAARPCPPAAARSTVTPAQLPSGVGDFVGRATAVQQVLNAARSASADSADEEARPPQIMTIVGGGGAGKTALAVHCGQLLAVALGRRPVDRPTPLRSRGWRWSRLAGLVGTGPGTGGSAGRRAPRRPAPGCSPGRRTPRPQGRAGFVVNPPAHPLPAS
jgi:hypothetical protein